MRRHHTGVTDGSFLREETKIVGIQTMVRNQ